LYFCANDTGNYIDVLEIILHPTQPVSPNQQNEDGITATYATLMMILKREVLDSEADLANIGLSKFERFWKAMRKKIELEPKLDLVLRALLYCGGKVDFQKMESGVDGTAVMHSAAETGALDMVDWLLKKGEERRTCVLLLCGCISRLGLTLAPATAGCWCAVVVLDCEPRLTELYVRQPCPLTFEYCV
jgi:hypothetical protein